MSAKEHAEAMLELARSAPGTTPLVVLDGAVPKGTLPPYALVYFVDHDPEDAESRSVEDAPGRFVLTGYWHLVGGNAAATRALADRLRAVLLGVTPTITGRVCFPIRREESRPPERDESTGQLVMDRVDLYRLSSEPA
ncbi:hypothetical protein ACWER9_06480 [Micromonospora sp. NPDC003944]